MTVQVRSLGILAHLTPLDGSFFGEEKVHIRYFILLCISIHKGKARFVTYVTFGYIKCYTVNI